MKKSVVNARPMAFCAAALMTGIAVYLTLMNRSAVFWLIVGLSSAGCLFLFFKQKNKLYAIVLLSFVAGMGLHFIQFKTSVRQHDGECYIRAKVSGITSGEGWYGITLTDLEIDSFDEPGRAYLRIYGENPYRFADRIHFVGTLKTKSADAFDASFLTSYGKGIFYDASLIAELSPPVDGADFFDRLRLRMLEPMTKWLANNKGIAASLLLGDTGELPREDRSSIRDTGLSHIFAVSGLHISFVVVCIALLLRKLKVKPAVGLGITAAVLFVYCGITGFPPSAVRSAIMAVIFSLSMVLHKKPDMLNSLGAAVFVMLAASPRTMYSLSFIMSVTAVFGIALFYRPLYKLFTKKGGKARRFVGASAAVSISSNVFLFPLSLNVFGTFSVYFVVANLLVLPIITVLYTYLFIVGTLCLISPLAGVLYYPANLLIELVRLISGFLASLPFAVLKGGGLGVFTAAYIVIMALFSRFVMLPKYNKLVCAFAVLLTGAVLFIIL